MSPVIQLERTLWKSNDGISRPVLEFAAYTNFDDSCHQRGEHDAQESAPAAPSRDERLVALCLVI